MVSLTMHPPPEAAAAATGASLSLLAGCSGGPGKLDGKAGVALLYRPSGMAMAPNGTLYISDNHNCIRQLTRAGEVSLFAGSHQAARGLLTDHSRSMGAVDGPASAARFRYPQGLVLDGAGNLYVADSGNHTIRKVSPAGQVTTLAGAAGMPGHVDARAGTARFHCPGDVAVDAAGTVYVLDTHNHVIRKITPDGLVSTLAGAAGLRGYVDGKGSAARFCFTTTYVAHAGGLALDDQDNVLVADFANRVVRKVSPAGDVTTFAAGFTGPASLRMGTNGDCVVFDTRADTVANVAAISGTLKKVSASGIVTLLAMTGGSSTRRFSGSACALALDRTGNIYLAESALDSVHKITPEGHVSSLVGGGTSGLAAGAATRFIDSFAHLSQDAAGNLYRFDASGCIWKIAPGGQVTSIATPHLQIPGFRFAGGTVDAAGHLYVVNMNSSTPPPGLHAAIRKITPDGTVTLLAGGASRGHTDGTGEAASFGLSSPGAIAVDTLGNVWISDNSAIRKITPDGQVTTLAGSATTPGVEDGLSTNARLAHISSLCLDTLGNLFVFDTGRVRKITPEGKVTTLAGRMTNFKTEPQNGKGSTACFGLSGCITCDEANNLFVTDPDFHVVRKITPTGMVSTVIGQLDRAGTVPGPLPASLFAPFGIAALPNGQLALTSGNALLLTQGGMH